MRSMFVRACAGMVIALSTYSATHGGIIVTDGFGDGDRDNNGLDAGATATNASDVGLAWYLTNGTTAVTLGAIDDTGGIDSGNALRLFNTASNNRPIVGHLASAVTLADGESLLFNSTCAW